MKGGRMAATRKKTATKRRAAAKKKVTKPKRVRAPARKSRPVKVKKTARVRLDKDAVGVVTHYFPKVRAAVIKLIKPLSVGDTLRVKGHTTDFKQQVLSIQIDHARVDKAGRGDEIGLGVTSRVREHDVVLKV
jgi:hypothetical protein